MNTNLKSIQIRDENFSHQIRHFLLKTFKACKLNQLKYCIEEINNKNEQLLSPKNGQFLPKYIFNSAA